MIFFRLMANAQTGFELIAGMVIGERRFGLYIGEKQGNVSSCSSADFRLNLVKVDIFGQHYKNICSRCYSHLAEKCYDYMG